MHSSAFRGVVCNAKDSTNGWFYSLTFYLKNRFDIIVDVLHDDNKLFLFHCRKEMLEESMMHSFGHHQAHHHQHLHHQHHQQQMCNNGQMMVPHDYGGDLAMSAKMLDARLTDDVRVNLSFVKNEPLPPSYLRPPFDHSHHRFPHTIPPVWERLWRHLALLCHFPPLCRQFATCRKVVDFRRVIRHSILGIYW